MSTISWKDIVESHIQYMNDYGVPEDLYSDPMESEEEDCSTSSES